MLAANSPLGNYLLRFFHLEIPVGIGRFKMYKTVEHWINDGLMSIFFLLAGLEIKRELLHGELSSFKKASLPVLAALGGMLVPALIFSLVNLGEYTIRGWAIPMATDIAFAIGVLAIAGKYVPRTLKVFLIALAIVDDIGAILVIAFFYSSTLAINYLLYAIVILAVMLLYNFLNIRYVSLYVINGIVLWYFIYMSGIHSTIAGVLMAFTIPYKTNDGFKPLHKIEHAIINPVNFVVLPLFALVNTAIVLNLEMFSSFLTPLSIGIFLGLVAGKPIGILLFSYLGIKTGISHLPHQVSWLQMAGAGALAGIGFTMSIFIGLLSFNDLAHQTISKIAVLAASTASAFIGFYLLKYASEKQKTIAPRV